MQALSYAAGQISGLPGLAAKTPRGGVIFSDGVESDTLAFNSGSVATFLAAERKTRLAAA